MLYCRWNPSLCKGRPCLLAPKPLSYKPLKEVKNVFVRKRAVVRGPLAKLPDEGAQGLGETFTTHLQLVRRHFADRFLLPRFVSVTVLAVSREQFRLAASAIDAVGNNAEIACL